MMNKLDFQRELYEVAGGCDIPVMDGCNKDTVVIGWEVFEKQWSGNPLGENFPEIVVSIKSIAKYVGQKEAMEFEDRKRLEHIQLISKPFLSYETMPIFAKVPKFVKVQQ